MITKLKNKIFKGEKITKDEAKSLILAPLDELLECANEIRAHFCKNKFDMCSIINAKSGKCSENCKFCAQSSFYKTKVENYPFLDIEKIAQKAKMAHEAGILRFSIVTSGRKPTNDELLRIASAIKLIKKTCEIEVCASCGLLNYDELLLLKNAGLTRFHNNLEASEDFFKTVCTTHSTKDKIKSLKDAQTAGLSVCSGGIIGLGESFNDRINMAFLLSEIGVKSIPINILSAIEGTPFEKNEKLEEEDILRTVAIFRFINPDAFIRLAGGRIALSDNGKRCLKSGVNALITGDMLTTCGIGVKDDIKMASDMGFEIKL